MRNLILFSLVLIFFTQCNKYKDPDPFTDPRLTNPYCNIPSAINYNWNFPGIPDNSTCIFPAQIYNGNYFYRDSFYNEMETLVGKDSFDIQFDDIDTTQLLITGFCNSLSLKAKANRFFKFQLDSNTTKGQLFCRTIDTIAGNGYANSINDTIIHLTYTILTDTGIVYHKGIATKK